MKTAFLSSKIILISFTKQAIPAYICQVLCSNYFLGYTQQCATASKCRVSARTMHDKGLNPLPCLSEQKSIVSKIEKLFVFLDQLNKAFFSLYQKKAICFYKNTNGHSFPFYYGI